METKRLFTFAFLALLVGLGIGTITTWVEVDLAEAMDQAMEEAFGELNAAFGGEAQDAQPDGAAGLFEAMIGPDTSLEFSLLGEESVELNLFGSADFPGYVLTGIGALAALFALLGVFGHSEARPIGAALCCGGLLVSGWTLVDYLSNEAFHPREGLFLYLAGFAGGAIFMAAAGRLR